MSEKEKLLDLLNEEELKQVLKHIDANDLLTPIKNNPKTYSQQAKKLGSMNAKSTLVQNLLPGMVVPLVKRNDKSFVILINEKLRDESIKLKKYIEEYKGNHMLSHSVAESYAKLFWDYKRTAAQTIDEAFFWILLKLCGDDISEEEKERITYNMRIQEELIKLSDEKDEQIELLKHNNKIEINQINTAHAKEIKELNQEISRLNHVIQKDKDQLEQIWKAEVEAQHAERLKELEAAYSEKYRELDEQAQNKKTAFAKEIEELENSLKKRFTDQESHFCNIIDGLERTKNDLELDCNSLTAELDSLLAQKAELDSYIDEYFTSFETHSVQMKIDDILKSRFASLIMESSSQIATIEEKQSVQNSCNLFVYGGEQLISDNEPIESENAKDVVIDFCDNLSVYFNQSLEIAKTFLSAYYSGKSILIDAASARKFSDCISALLDSKKATIIDVNDGKYSTQDIVTTINGIDESVILVNGIIDRYDDKITSCIVDNADDKIVIFSYSDIDALKCISSTSKLNCIIMDLEEFIKFEEDEELFTGNYKLDDYAPEIDNKVIVNIHKSIFSKLHDNKMITNCIARELSLFVSYYYALSENNSLSTCIKDTISHYMQYDSESEESCHLLESVGLA